VIAECESLNSATVGPPYTPRTSILAMSIRSRTPLVHCSVSNTFLCPVPRQLQQTVWPTPHKYTTEATTLPLSVGDRSIHQVDVPDPSMLPFLVAHSSAALLATVLTYSLVVLIAGSSPWSGPYIYSALLPCAALPHPPYLLVYQVWGNCSALSTWSHFTCWLAILPIVVFWCRG